MAFVTMAPIQRARMEIHAVFRSAERYRIGILKKIQTFGKYTSTPWYIRGNAIT